MVLVHPASFWNHQKGIARLPANRGPAAGGIVEAVGGRRRTVEVLALALAVVGIYTYIDIDIGIDIGIVGSRSCKGLVSIA